MATTGSVTIIGSVQETLDTPENRLGTITDYLNINYAWTDGVAATQNDIVWSDRRTIAAGLTDTLDFTGDATMTDAFGTALVFVEITAIIISNRETVAGSRTLSFGPNAAAEPFLFLFLDASDLVSIVPGGGYCMWSDEAQTLVVDVNDKMRLVNTDGANAVVYDVIVVGRTA